MGTYISHLRNAEILFTATKDLDAGAFLLGNLAPDSGIPNKDWTRFDPPRVITHFLIHNKRLSRDLDFYRQYLISKEYQTSTRHYSFLLGYFIHLICDNLWLLWIVEASKRDYQATIKTTESDG